MYEVFDIPCQSLTFSTGYSRRRVASFSTIYHPFSKILGTFWSQKKCSTSALVVRAFQLSMTRVILVDSERTLVTLLVTIEFVLLARFSVQTRPDFENNDLNDSLIWSLFGHSIFWALTPAFWHTAQARCSRSPTSDAFLIIATPSDQSY